MHQESRRSFVRKSLATSISISFAGLIRAHGEEGGGTTTWNPDGTTIGTTDSGGTTTWSPDESTMVMTTVGGVATWNPDESTMVTTTVGENTTWNPDESTMVMTTVAEITTWNPDETTATTVVDGINSLQKQIPVPVSSPFTDTRTRHLQAPAGIIQIHVAGVLFFQISPMWDVYISERVTIGPPNEYVSEDCVTYDTEVDISMDLLGPMPPPVGIARKILLSVSNGVTKILNPLRFPLHVPDPVPTVVGPELRAGYSVAATSGFDYGVPGQVGPLVTVGERLGRVATSSHGYWLTVDSESNPNQPSRSVNFIWKMKLRLSQNFNLHNHIRSAILDQLNIGAINDVVAANPGKVVTGNCEIWPLPDITTPSPFSQLVVAFALPPTSNGQSCPVMDPSAFGRGSGLTPGDSDESDPDDAQWKKVDPPIPTCPLIA